MTKNNLPQPHRLHFVDALRGFAAIYVVVFHIVNVPQPNLRTPAFITPIIINGGSGITLFFMISAFTLCYTLRGKLHHPQSTVTFYIRRICRIAPLYYLWLIIMILLNWGCNLYFLKNPDFYLYAVFGYNLAPGKQYGIVPAGWTLSIEMIFYLFFPLLFKWVTNLKKAVVFFLLTLLMSYVHYVVMLQLNIDKYIIEMNILSHLPSFAAGIVTFYIYEIIRVKNLRNSGLLIFSIGVILFFTVPYLFTYMQAGYFTKAYMMTFTYAIIFIGLSIRPVPFFTNRAVVFFGTISYSLYLNHPQFIWRLFSVYDRVYNWGLPVSLSWFICSMLTIVPLIGVSYVTYHFIEKPGMAIGKTLIKKMAHRRENKREVLKPAPHFDSSIG